MLENILNALPPCPVLALPGPCAPIDLSASGPNAGAQISDAFIETLLLQAGVRFLAGGYMEKRQLYRRSELFGQDRDIHIGIDLWAPAGTPVLAPLDGTIHSFNYNPGIGNYGPTIILQHKIDGLTFYTLYGHLSAADLEELEVGDIVPAGSELGCLGSRHENGDYAPHLHFQIIRDLEGSIGDYPGVCRAADVPHYASNCPDPNLLLKLDIK